MHQEKEHEKYRIDDRKGIGRGLGQDNAVTRLCGRHLVLLQVGRTKTTFTNFFGVSDISLTSLLGVRKVQKYSRKEEPSEQSVRKWFRREHPRLFNSVIKDYEDENEDDGKNLHAGRAAVTIPVIKERKE